jgi:hypothetical protein
VDLNSLKEVTKHPGWQLYLDYLEDLQIAALEQMMTLDLSQQEEFIALNSRLVLLKQISRDFELDLNDNGKKTDQENFERLQSIDETYRRRFQGFLKRLLRRP